MVAHGRGAASGVDARLDCVADAQRTRRHHPMVAKHRRLDFLRVLNLEQPVWPAQQAAVADLPARFGIERRFIQHHHADLALVQGFDSGTVPIQRHHAGVGIEPLVTVERGLRAAVVEVGAHLELASCARLRLLTRHGGLEAGLVDADAALAADVRREVEREAIGVVQFEGGLAVNVPRSDGVFQNVHAVGDGGEEALLLLPQHV